MLKKYMVFSGRAQRQEYWYFVLVASIVAMVVFAIDVAAGTYSRDADIGLFSGAFLASIFLPSVAVGVRRLHDMGKPGWWWLISLIPLIGAIALLIMCAQPGESGHNQYGPDPQAANPPIDSDDVVRPAGRSLSSQAVGITGSELLRPSQQMTPEINAREEMPIRSRGLLVGWWMAFVFSWLLPVLAVAVIPSLEGVFSSFGSDLPQTTAAVVKYSWILFLFPLLVFVPSVIVSTQSRMHAEAQRKYKNRLLASSGALVGVFAFVIFAMYLPLMRLGATA